MQLRFPNSHPSITPLLQHSTTPPLRFMKPRPAINDLLAVMARLRSPKGCPWDREQDHMTLRWHAVEEVYELLDAIEAEDDHETGRGAGRPAPASCLPLPTGPGKECI